MAYKPKYSRSSVRAKQAVTRQENIQPPVRKQSRGKLTLFILLGLVIIPASLYFSGMVLKHMVHYVGKPKTAAYSKTGSIDIPERLGALVEEELDSARRLLLNEKRPEGEEAETPEATEETLPPVRKVYWIEEGTQVAPEPDQALFGSSSDPETLQQVLQRAKWLLDGQETYFQPIGARYENNTATTYYLDDSILALCWQEVHDGSVYTFSEIKVSHPSQFRRHLAGGEYGSDMQFLTTEMAEAVNAVVASAGDFYRFRDFGAVVYEGEAKRVEGTYAETCYIDREGNMHFTYGGDVLTVEEVQAFVDEHDIQFSLAFGPILVDNYELVGHTWYGVGEIDEGYARAALCQLDELHYIVVAANTTGPYQEIPTVAMFAKNIAATGCRMAYCLDGGQTATIVMNDKLMNRPVYGQQRKISDIIYFATAIPDGGGDNG
ncbi:MAG: phosphodiester glycosidase family protein [Oscillospiraceae bacterium]|nr:phosphodiester glycosidase family protein [Oscillospiraceae bacterium]